MGAAQQLLDRIGIVKKERLQVTVDADKAIFLLPAKDIPYENTEKD
jgi:hypothetical protein